MNPKFRAWDKGRKRMVEVTSISFWGGTIQEDTLHAVNRELYFDQVKLMQYTGLKDKNGVEIYEGDIVNITQYFAGSPYGEMKHIIKRSEYNNDLVAYSESRNWMTPEVNMSFRKSDDYEVIGDIYENPELLEEEE